MLSDAQTERYSRQIILREIGARGQERLLSATIALVIAEPSTSYALHYLAAAGIGRICVASAGGIDDVAGLNPDCRIEPQELPSSYDDWIATARPDAVVLEADDDASSAAVNSACIRTGTPLLWGQTAGARAYMALFDATVTPGCYACTDVRSRIMTAEPVALQPLAASMLASLQAAEAIKLALKQKPALLGRGLVVDAASSSIDSLSFVRKTACPVCDPGPRP
jgi:adenylyltransferase/sulfurtransferase